MQGKEINGNRKVIDLIKDKACKQKDIDFIEVSGHNKSRDWINGYEEGVRFYGEYLLLSIANEIKDKCKKNDNNKNKETN